LALPAGVALSRLAFDVALAAEAVQAGAAFLAETQAGPTTSASAARLVRLQCRGQSVEVRARVVLAACGLSGSFGAEQRPEIAAGSRIGAGLLLPDGPAFFAPGTIYMACGRSGYLGAVRVENGQLDLAAALAPEAVRAAGGPGRAAEALLEGTGWPAIPGLHRGPWRGTPALTRRAGRLAAPRLFFLGDAAGYVEPFTGEGIAWALASAHAVVPLALRGVYSWQPELAAEWTTLHRRLVGRRQWMCRALAAALRRPWLTRGLVEGLARLPGAAAALLRWFHAVPAHWEANHEFCDPWLGDRAAAAHHFARPGRGGGPAALLHEPGGGSDAHPALPAVRD
jgi:2-polyprenyl-6-methoxyphenol hydroxylase-like FAD-dependent oxidoreductase